MSSTTGKYLIVAGLLLTAIGIIIYFFSNKLHWVGRLPGDIRVENKNLRFYFPITTMILASILLNLIIVVIKRFLN